MSAESRRSIDVPRSRTAVLCVECQNGVLGPDPVLPGLADGVGPLVDNLARLLGTARAQGIPVVHATFEGHPAGATEVGTARIWGLLSSATRHWSPGHDEVAVLPSLSDPRDLVVPRHHGLFPTLDTELIPVLKSLGVDSVVLTGVSLNIAISFTAAHLGQSGLRVVVPRDAVGGTPQEFTELALKHSVAMLAQLSSVDELIDGWSATPDSAGQ